MSQFQLWHYDGETATRRIVKLRADAHGFRLEDVENDWTGPRISWSDLLFIGREAGRSAYGHRQIPGWRLGFSGDAPPDIAARLPGGERYGRWIDRFGLWPAAGAFALAAAVVVYGVLQSPAWLAPLVPQSWENSMGDAMVGDLGGRVCHGGAGEAALAQMVAKIDPKGEAREVVVANIPLINAITLPGGRIILFDGLLQLAQSPDEVAGVLGHELGHVRHRDTMAGLIRQLGLSVVLGGFSGDAGGYLNGALALSYGREAEDAADGVAIEQMRAAHVSPAATAGFFERLGHVEGDDDAARAMTWLSSHPLSADRRARFAGAVDKNAQYAPALDTVQWKALLAMCASDPDVADPWGRQK